MSTRTTFRKHLGFFFMLASVMLFPQAALSQWITGFVQGEGGESPSHVPWSKYTHIIHYAVNPNTDGTISNGSLSPSENSALVAAGHAAGKKVLYDVYDNRTSNFGPATSSGTLSTFVTNLIAYMNTYGYDGIDLDWESSINVSQYESLISTLRSRIGAGKLITMNVYPDQPMQVAANQAANLDQINVMSYDNDEHSTTTWHNSAVLQRTPGNDDSQQGGMLTAIASGIPKAKIGVGVPFYGRHYTGTDAPEQSGGTNVGTIFYRNVAVNSSIFNSTTLKWDSTYEADYLSLTSTNEFYTINGVRGVAATAAFVKAQGLGGVMVFEIDHEWIQSASGDAQWPLSTALYSAMFGGSGGGGGTGTAPTITSTSPLPAGTVGTTYSQTISASGTTPLTWSITSGALAQGLSFDAVDGMISGTPNTAGTSIFTIEASNASGSDSQQFSLAVNPRSVTPVFTFVSQNSGKCLDVPGSSMQENVQLDQQACANADNQKFQLIAVSGGYKIINKNSGLGVNVRGGTRATQNGAAVIQWPYSGASNEIWAAHPYVDGSYSFTVKNSGKCMDVTGVSKANGAPIQQWGCTGSANQRWTLTPAQ